MRNVLLLGLLLAGCTVGPDYRTPDAAGVAAAFKEAPPGWTAARPQDDAAKGPWWAIYRDPLLSRLEEQVAVSNQNVAGYEAQLREAEATVDASRSSLFPTLTGTTSATRSSTGGAGGKASNLYTLEGSASWDLDVWGRIRRQIESDVAAAQVSAADLANATLSAQATLATDYFELRYEDALQKLLTDTVAAYADTLRITLNQYAAGISSSADVSSAQTQLDGAKAQLVGVGVLRSQYEHAIAVLAGLSPAELTIASADLAGDVPAPAGVIPSTLLQRRPDIAAAERAMRQENALIGVQIAAFYPDISLSADLGFSGGALGSLVKAANRFWSIGASGTETLFEGGYRNSEVAVARATYDASVSSYRQTVLTAFQQIEDQLSNLRVLERQAEAEAEAVRSAQRSVQVALNTYRAGTAAYTNVVTQQTALLTDQETALGVQESRLVASVTLVEDLGGGFVSDDLPSADSLQQGLPFLKR